jgi:AraC-like DNA-binding protein
MQFRQKYVYQSRELKLETHTFHDFDAFKSAVRGVDCSMLPHNVERNSWSISKVGVGGPTLQFGQLGSGNILEGESQSDGFIFYFPVTAGAKYLGNGIPFSTESIMVLTPGTDFTLCSKLAHDWYTIFIPTNTLSDYLDPLESLSKSSIFTHSMLQVIRPDRQFFNSCCAVMGQIIHAASPTPLFEHSPAALSARRQLLEIATAALGKIQPINPHTKGRHSLSRRLIIQQCRDLLAEHADETVLVRDLVAATNVSERTLRSAFSRYFAMGPKNYLLLRQLDQVRRSLQVANDANTSVAEVMVSHGVWEFGRFALRYYQVFAEHPAETLKKEYI